MEEDWSLERFCFSLEMQNIYSSLLLNSETLELASFPIVEYQSPGLGDILVFPVIELHPVSKFRR